MSKADWVSQVRRVEKPWGHEDWFTLVDGEFAAVEPRAGVVTRRPRRTPVRGAHEAHLEQFELLPAESIHLTPGPRHRVTALADTVMLEASTTEITDVVRLEDRYGRQGTTVD